MKFITALVCAALLAAAAFANDPEASIDGVVDLSADNFDDVVGKDKGVLVEFYAPWCGHCKNLVPEYTRLGKAAKGSASVTVAKLDAQKHSELGSKFGVTGFPTIKFFPKGSVEPEEYNDGRDAESFVKFLNSKTGSSLFIPKDFEYVKTLGASNFDSIALDTTKDVLVEFYAPWCGHCKSLAPDYEIVAKTFQTEKDVVIAKVNADEASNKGLASKYGVTGFPTIKFFPKDDKSGKDYNEGRTPSDFVQFINRNCDTRRKVGGSLDDEAGTDADLTALAAQYLEKSDEAARKDIKDKMTARIGELSGTAAEDGKLYIKVVAKIDEKGDKVVAKEIARLTKLLESGSVNINKQDSMAKRLNVLKTFSA